LQDAHLLTIHHRGLSIEVKRPILFKDGVSCAEKLIHIELRDDELSVEFANRHHADPIMNILALANIPGIQSGKDPGTNHYTIPLAHPQMFEQLKDAVDKALRMAGL
jgi:hypothetical protein